MTPIILDTIGKLHEHRHGLFGWCRPCSSRYRMAARPEDNPPAIFDIDLATLIAERGPDPLVIGMAPVTCPYCCSRQTEIRILGVGPKHRPSVPVHASAAPPAGSC